MLSFEAAVRPFLSAPVVTIAEGASADEAVATLRAREVSSLLVVDAEGKAVGVVSRTDLLHGAGDGVRERMTASVITVEADDSIAAASRAMASRGIHRVYVLERGLPLGVFSTREIMMAVRDARDETPLARMMSSPVRTVGFDSTVHEATALLAEGPIGALVVVENGHPVGLFSQREALAARWVPPETAVEAVMSPSLLCLRPGVPAHRAAAFTVSTRARRILVTEDHAMKGLVSGMDFAWLAAGEDSPGPFALESTGSNRA